MFYVGLSQALQSSIEICTSMSKSANPATKCAQSHWNFLSASPAAHDYRAVLDRAPHNEYAGND
jgi:hypothetical protein